MSAFSTGAPGCCCCQFMYHGDSGPRAINMGKYVLDGYRVQPEDHAIGGSKWHLDCWHKRLYLIVWLGYGHPSNRIRWYPAKVPLLRDDAEYTNVQNLATNANPVNICTASEDEQIYYVVQDIHEIGGGFVAIDDNVLHFRRVEFDGTGDTEIFTRTSESGVNVLPQLEHCRANNRLYYTMDKDGEPGVTRYKLYACDRDGANDALVFDGTGTLNAMASRSGFTIDNTRQKLYCITRGEIGGPFEGSILRMDLDGSNQETIYTTSPPRVSPYGGYGVHCLRYSHQLDALFWFEGSNATDTQDGTGDPGSGLWKGAHDASDPVLIANAWEFGQSSASSPNLGFFKIGCGFETTGPSTRA